MADALDVWVRKLRDSEVATRRDAIRQLEALGESGALGPLATIFALDPDLETRRLAQWAGKSIYQTIERRTNNQAAAISEKDRRNAADILAKAQSKKSPSR